MFQDDGCSYVGSGGFHIHTLQTLIDTKGYKTKLLWAVQIILQPAVEITIRLSNYTINFLISTEGSNFYLLAFRYAFLNIYIYLVFLEALCTFLSNLMEIFIYKTGIRF